MPWQLLISLLQQSFGGVSAFESAEGCAHDVDGGPIRSVRRGSGPDALNRGKSGRGRVGRPEQSRGHGPAPYVLQATSRGCFGPGADGFVRARHWATGPGSGASGFWVVKMPVGPRLGRVAPPGPA